MALRRTRSLERYITESGVAYADIGVAIADYVECVEGVKAETYGVPLGKVEVLEGGQIRVEETGTVYRAIA